MPKPARTAAPKTAENIRVAAAELFVARSYADVTIDQVADAANVTKGAVYHHFDSKEQLYLDTLLRDLAAKRDRNQRFVDDAESSCRERLRSLTAAFLALPATERRLIQLVRRDANIFGESTRAELVAAYQAALPDPIERILRDGVRDGDVVPCDPRILAWQFVALVEVLLTDYADQRFSCDHDKLNYVMSVFFRGCGRATPGGDA